MTSKELEIFKKVPRNDFLIYLHQNSFLNYPIKIEDLYDRINKTTAVFCIIIDDLIRAKLIECSDYQSRQNDKSSFLPSELTKVKIELTKLGKDYVESRIFGFNHSKYDDMHNPVEQIRIRNMSARLISCYRWSFEQLKSTWSDQWINAKEAYYILTGNNFKENHEKKVFISYSWDNPKHKEWVANLAKDLQKEFSVEFDQNLEIGMSPENYMKHNILSSDYVVIIFTPDYCSRANSELESGVKYEFSIVRNELFRKMSNGKYIPILRKGNKTESIPKEMQDAIYLNMQSDEDYKERISELISKISN